jgi:hypothetical protein
VPPLTRISWGLHNLRQYVSQSVGRSMEGVQRDPWATRIGDMGCPVRCDVILMQQITDRYLRNLSTKLNKLAS